MALSGSSSTIFSNNSSFRLRIQWSASQNLAGNYSDVTAELYLDSISAYGAVSDGTSSTTTITINGNTTTFYVNSSLSAWQNKYLGTHTVRVYHESDGNKQIQIAASHNFDITWNGAWVGTVYTESWPWLDRLQRASTVWLSNPTTGDPVTTVEYGQPVRINITASDASFKHSIGVYWHDWSSLIMDKDTPRTKDWTVPLSLMSYIPNGTASWGTIAVDTWTSDNVYIGGTEIRLDTTVPASAKPSLTTITMLEQNSAVSTLMGTGFYVQGVSIPRAIISGHTAQYGASISSYEFVFEGKTYINYGNTKDFDKPLTYGPAQTVTCRVKDSRGLWSNSISTNINVLQYSAPTLTTFSAARTNNTNSTTINVERHGVTSTLYNGTISKNSVTIVIDYRQTGGTTYTQGYTTTFSGGNYGTSVSIGMAFAVGNSYDIRISVTDAFSPAVIATTVVGAIVKPFSIGPTGIGAGKIWQQGALDVGGDAFISGNLNLTGTDGNVYHTGKKPTTGDIGAAKALTTANGYPGLTHNDGTTTEWLRTTSNGLIPFSSGGYSSSLGTVNWPFRDVHAQNMYLGGKNLAATTAINASPNTGIWHYNDYSGGGFSYMKYWKTVDNIIHMQGLAYLESGYRGDFQTLFTLPVGYRPHAIVTFTVACATGTTRIDIGPAGNVQLRGTSSPDWVSLAGIAFYQAN